MISFKGGQVKNIFYRVNIWPYFGFLVWGLVVFVGTLRPTTPLIFLLGFLFFIYWPGFSLARILKINIDGDLFGQNMIYLTTGFVVNLFLCLVAVIVQTNIFVMEFGYFVVLGILFILALISDLKRPAETTKIIWRNYFQLDNLIFAIPVFLIIIIALTINYLGANFAGDPSYHIAIMRKVVEDGPMGLNTLSLVKDNPQPQYAYLIWPVFLGFMSKIFHLNIFNLWNEIIVGLFVLVTLAWAWMSKQIFRQKYLIVIALIIFLIFNLTNSAWLLTRLTVPDSFSKLFLLPLSLALAFQYIFSKKPDWKVLSLNALLLMLTACIHLTQFIYFFFMLGAFLLLYLVFFWKDKTVIKRILLIMAVSIVLTAPLFIFLALTTSAFTINLQWFATVKLALIYGHFNKYELPVQLAFIFLPLTFLFFRRNPKILFLFSIMLIAPIIYAIEPLRDFLSLKLSYVFMRRLFSNTTWYFAIWTLVVGFVVILGDRLWTFLTNKLPRWKTSIDYLGGVVVILFIILGIKYHFLANAYQVVFAKSTELYLEKNFVWLIAVISIFTIIGIIIQKYSQKAQNLFEFNQSKNPIIIFCLILLFTFWLISDSQLFLAQNVALDLASHRFIQPVSDATDKVASVESIGGPEVLNFIKTNIPQRSIFETNSGYLDLPEFVDVYVAAYPGAGKSEKELSNLYEREGVPMADKLTCLAWYKVDYLLITTSMHKIEKMGFNDQPEYLTKIYPKEVKVLTPNSQTSVIYKVDWPKLQADYPYNGPNPPICRSKKFPNIGLTQMEL